MKIAYDHQTFCMQAYGGISRYHVHLAEQLAQMQEHVQIFAPVHRNQYLSSLSDTLVRGRGVRRYRIPGSRFMLRFNELIARRQIAAWRPDIVHETYYSATTLTPGDCPAIITVHDMTHELFTDQFRPGDRTAELKRQAVERADHVICVSESTRSDLLRLLDIPKEKTTVVHLGIQSLRVMQNKNTLREHSDKPYIAFVGQRGGYKNFRGLLEAITLSRRLRNDFNVKAFGGSSFRSRERQEIRALGFSDDQVQHISGSDSVLADFYSQASILVYPSLYEGFGLPPLEAMALDCPVVSSRISSMPEVLGDAAEYFESGSVEGLQSAIESVLYSPTRAEELRRLGRLRVGRYTWLACAQGTQAVYRRFVNQ